MERKTEPNLMSSSGLIPSFSDIVGMSFAKFSAILGTLGFMLGAVFFFLLRKHEEASLFSASVVWAVFTIGPILSAVVALALSGFISGLRRK